MINYDAPKEIATYVHRIGRTGRIGHRGTAMTFVTMEAKEKGVVVILGGSWVTEICLVGEKHGVSHHGLFLGWWILVGWRRRTNHE